MDLSVLSSAVDFAGAGAEILAIGAAVLGVLVVVKAVKLVKRAL